MGQVFFYKDEKKKKMGQVLNKDKKNGPIAHWSLKHSE